MTVVDIPENLHFEHAIWSAGRTAIAGVDEVGRGPLAGPVVAAAVIFPPYDHLPGVTDSKLLSHPRRVALADRIRSTALAIGMGVIEPDEIDRINIRQATFRAMRMALEQLAIPPDYLLVDGEELPGAQWPQEGLVKGDRLSFTVAAASILAKVHRDALMCGFHERWPDYGFDRHKGYGTAEHRRVLREIGPCPIHRRSFLGKILGGGVG